MIASSHLAFVKMREGTAGPVLVRTMGGARSDSHGRGNLKRGLTLQWTLGGCDPSSCRHGGEGGSDDGKGCLERFKRGRELRRPVIVVFYPMFPAVLVPPLWSLRAPPVRKFLSVSKVIESFIARRPQLLPCDASHGHEAVCSSIASTVRGIPQAAQEQLSILQY